MTVKYDDPDETAPEQPGASDVRPGDQTPDEQMPAGADPVVADNADEPVQAQHEAAGAETAAEMRQDLAAESNVRDDPADQNELPVEAAVAGIPHSEAPYGGATETVDDANSEASSAAELTGGPAENDMATRSDEVTDEPVTGPEAADELDINDVAAAAEVPDDAAAEAGGPGHISDAVISDTPIDAAPTGATAEDASASSTQGDDRSPDGQATDDATSFDGEEAAVTSDGAKSEDNGDLVLDLDGYEGPIDVLLALARDQKVDLKKLSILELADQYLAFVARARRLRLELAADYLVMAAWLAYLKSRLLLPEPPSDGEPSGAEMAAALAFQLQRLEAMQKAGQALLALPQLNRDFFRRGEPEPVRIIQVPVYNLSLYELLKAYGTHPGRKREGILHIEPLRLFSMDDALHRIGELLGQTLDWTTLRRFLPSELQETPLQRRAAMAATFAASLELARSGRIQLRQDGTFGPIYVRRAEPQADEAMINQGSIE